MNNEHEHGTPEWRREMSRIPDEAMLHEIMVDVMDELLGNLGRRGDGLASYGVEKVARYGALVGACVALGIDPILLRLTPAEANAHMLKIAEVLRGAGKAVTVTDGKSFEVRLDGANGE